MNERLHIHKKADPSASKSVHTQFQSRPTTAQEQPHSVQPQSQTKIDNQEFQQHKFEATKLEIEAKHGTITPQGQEQLTVLQAKMSNLLQRQVEHTSRFGHNAAKSAINCPDTPPPSSIQAKLNIGKPEESNQETFIEQKFPPPLQMQPLSRGRLPMSQSLVQPKFTIGQPGDKYEQEADQVASQVVNQINAPVPQQSSQSQSVQREAVSEEEDELRMKPEISTIQREAVSEEEEELQTKPMLQLQPSGGGMAAAPDLEASIQQAQGSGQPLADSIRQPMEQAFGADFSNVKVHTDTQSDQLNQSIQARAFTTGQDVFFRQGEYNPGSRGGQELLAHELTHVVQQSGGLVQRAAQLEPANLRPSAHQIIQRLTVIEAGTQDYPAKKESKKLRKDKDATEDKDFFVSQEERDGSFYKIDAQNNFEANLVYKSNANLMISDNLDLAIEAEVESKFFFATSERIKEANAALKGGIELKATDKYLAINSDGGVKKLFQVQASVPTNKKSRGKEGKGLKMKIPQRCNEMADFVTGKKGGVDFMAGLQVYEQLANILSGITKINYSEQFATIKPKIGSAEGNKEYLEITGHMEEKFKEVNIPTNEVSINELMQRFKINEYIDPNIGDVITTYGVGTEEERKAADKSTTFGYHFGSVVAKSGSDYITLENYARRDPEVKEQTASSNDPLFFFKMYGNHESANSWHEKSLATGAFIGRAISFIVA